MHQGPIKYIDRLSAQTQTHISSSGNTHTQTYWGTETDTHMDANTHINKVTNIDTDSHTTRSLHIPRYRHAQQHTDKLRHQCISLVCVVQPLCEEKPDFLTG